MINLLEAERIDRGELPSENCLQNLRYSIQLAQLQGPPVVYSILLNVEGKLLTYGNQKPSSCQFLSPERLKLQNSFRNGKCTVQIIVYFLVLIQIVMNGPVYSIDEFGFSE